jgi:hypothetical protein
MIENRMKKLLCDKNVVEYLSVVEMIFCWSFT